MSLYYYNVCQTLMNAPAHEGAPARFEQQCSYIPPNHLQAHQIMGHLDPFSVSPGGTLPSVQSFRISFCIDPWDHFSNTD